MRRYIAKRIGWGLFVIWLVATTVFLGLHALPGGPVESMMGPNVADQAIEELREKLGYNRPLWVQYVDWLTSIVTLDFGTDPMTGTPVAERVMNTAPRTLSIAMVGIIFGLSVSIPAGVVSALRKGEPADYVATIAAFSGISFPAFFTGILLMLVFAVHLELFPVFGYVPIKESFWGWLRHIILPGLAVGAPYTAIIMRMTRSSMLEVMGEQYMKTARSKGVRPRIRLFKHALQNAMIPVVTVAGIQIAIIVIGSVTVELVFGLAGIGRLLVDAILSRNYPVAQVVIVLTSTLLVGMNLLVDIVYTFIDPRIKYGGGA